MIQYLRINVNVQVHKYTKTCETLEFHTICNILRVQETRGVAGLSAMPRDSEIERCN